MKGKDPENLTITLFVDADACPVKDEIYKVALRYGLKVMVVANTRMHIPFNPLFNRVMVGDDIDAADDWIIDNMAADDIVVTNDIPLASRAVNRGAYAVSPLGKIFTENSVGDALATRDLITHLRDAGTVTGGPPPFNQRDRSRFLRSLDETIQKIKRKTLHAQCTTKFSISDKIPDKEDTS